MTRKTPNCKRTVCATVLAVLVLVGVYVGSYFLLGEYNDSSLNTTGYPTLLAIDSVRTRTFEHDELVVLFRPAGWVEANLRGWPIHLEGPESVHVCDPDW